MLMGLVTSPIPAHDVLENAPLNCLGVQPCTILQTSDDAREKSDLLCKPATPPENGNRIPEGKAAEQVLEKVYAIPESEKKFILGKLGNAKGFAIFPDVRKDGVMAATVYGKGIILYRDEMAEWSPPILLTMQGQSLGPQVCAQCSRIVFIFDTSTGVRDFLTGHHHFVTSTTGTSIEHVDHPKPGVPLNITIYTIHDGMAIGQSLDNYAIHIDEEANAALYGIQIKPGCIVEGVRIGPRPPWFQQFYERMMLPPGQPHGKTQIK